MHNNKIFILLPDGVGLRNFAYTNFYNLGKSLGYDITFWNNTAFDLQSLGLKQIKIKEARLHPKTDILKKAKMVIELKCNSRKEKDAVYSSYKHHYSFKNLKETVKSAAVKGYALWYGSQRGLKSIRKNIETQERKTKYYHDCLETLQREKPALVFCTNQRTTQGIAPIAAAKDLGIPTATFIFSWDNLPKASKVIETDYYFVWSEHMKSELLHYYPYVKAQDVFVTGTPQFECHSNATLILPKVDFFNLYNLDINKKYICYSGDDITTSPNDPEYLTDVADAVRKLNSNGHKLGIVFRRCPVDFSMRFDKVLEDNKDIITAIAPKWERIGHSWNAVLPTRDDMVLQVNTIHHTEMVINLGSSMVFDYAAHGKPCGFINYDIPNSPIRNWSVKMIYGYVHFRSMPNKKSVIWLNSPQEIAVEIEKVLSGNNGTVPYALEWFAKINKNPPHESSARILEAMGTIIGKK